MPGNMIWRGGSHTPLHTLSSTLILAHFLKENECKVNCNIWVIFFVNKDCIASLRLKFRGLGTKKICLIRLTHLFLLLRLLGSTNRQRKCFKRIGKNGNKIFFPVWRNGRHPAACLVSITCNEEFKSHVTNSLGVGLICYVTE